VTTKVPFSKKGKKIVRLLLVNGRPQVLHLLTTKESEFFIYSIIFIMLSKEIEEDYAKCSSEHVPYSLTISSVRSAMDIYVEEI